MNCPLVIHHLVPIMCLLFVAFKINSMTLLSKKIQKTQILSQNKN